MRIIGKKLYIFLDQGPADGVHPNTQDQSGRKD